MCCINSPVVEEMSQSFETVLRSLEKIAVGCKDRHAFLKACCSYASTRMKDPNHEDLSPEELSNILFYPLKVAAETREEGFVALALDAIQKMVAQGVIDSAQIYKSPDVPIPPKKKTLGSLFSNATDLPTPKNEREENVPLVSILINTVCLNSALTVEEIQMLVARTLLTTVCTQKCEVHGPQLLLAVRTCCNIYLQGRTPQVQTSAKTTLAQIIGTVQLRAETETRDLPPGTLPACNTNDETLSNPDSDVTDTLDDGTHDFKGMSERDCFLLFRSLCKLSSKTVADSAADSVEVRSKSLSLTLLYHFMSTVGDQFKQTEAFCQAIHKYLCGSLLQNCMSSIPEIAKVSLNILLTIFTTHRHNVKSKVPVFFIRVLFPLLDSANASFSHKSAVLSLFEKFVNDPQAVADLFVNFDCAVGCPNIFEQLVNQISKVAQATHTAPNWITSQQSEHLKLQSIATLSALTRSLVEWMTQQQSAAGSQRSLDAAETVPTDEEGVETVTEVERMIKDKRVYEAVIGTFNKKKGKDGIDLALQSGLIREETPMEVAQFLLTKGLDKVKIGEYLSQNKPFVKEVLRQFIYFNDFTGLEIDEAMRVFLGKFKIFGEAEVVDRTMEQFAEKYCSQNPHAFSSPGTAYILSFSIMMLNTDLHSIHVKAKMTADEFVRNNRGIDDEKDLPRPFLESIYNRIKTREIKLDGDSAASPVASSNNAEDNIFVSLEKKKQQNYKLETDSLVQNSLQLLTDDAPAEEYITAASPQIVAAMWAVTWTALLPALSVQMEESSDESTVDACLQAFDAAMRINCNFQLATERKAFLSSLLAFTHLTSLREIMYKNVKSIDTLIKIAAREGNFLEGSWHEILRCISLLDKLHLIGNASRLESLSGPHPHRGSVSQRAADHKRIEHHNAEMITAHVNLVEVDRIFSKSGELSGNAVTDLVEALCKVSAEELQENPQPRTFSLQKLVEVAEINVGRLRYFWSKMWSHMSKHFISVGLDKQQIVSMFVVDSLRQLSVKFLQRDELGNFNFQRDFLKPFEVIASQTKRFEIRELIIASLGQMVDSRAENIMSGWKIVINTLAKCSSDSHLSVVSSAFDLLRRLTLRHMYLLATPDLFTELINAWSMFGGNVVDHSVAESSISIIQLIAVIIENGIPPRSHPIYTQDFSSEALQAFSQLKGPENIPLLASGKKHDIKIWLSLLAALSSLSSVQDVEIRFLSLDALFSTLSVHGSIFTADDWSMIMGGTIFPIFDNILCDLNLLSTSGSEELVESFESQSQLLSKTMQGASDLFAHFFPELGNQLEEMTNTFLQCGRKNSPNIAKVGFDHFVLLLKSLDAANHLSQEHWSSIERRLIIACEYGCNQIQHNFLRPATAGKSDEPTDCVVALALLLEMMSHVMVLPSLPSSCIGTFMTTFLDSFSVAAAVLEDHASGRTLPELAVMPLFELERVSCAAFIASIPKSSDTEQIVRWSTNVMKRCVSIYNANASSMEYLVIESTVVRLLEILIELPDDRFLAFVDEAYAEICETISVCSESISKILVKVFLRVGALRGPRN